MAAHVSASSSSSFLVLNLPSVASTTTLILRLIASYFVFFISRTIYDIYFGPLSHVPGPKLAAATRLVFVYYNLTGRGDAWLAELHKKYGRVVRPGPYEVSFTHADAIRDIYGYKSGSKYARLEKDFRFYRTWTEDRNMNVANEVDAHRQRKVFNHAFSEKAVNVDQLPLLQGYVNQFLDNVRDASKTGAKLDLVKNYNFMTFDIMADLSFGEPLGCLRNSAYTPWIAMIFSSLKVMQLDIELTNYPTIHKIMQWLTPKSAMEDFEKHQRNSWDRVDKRLAATVDRPDIWGQVIQANEKEESRIRLGEMHANAEVFMIAGTETTATLLSGLTYYLLKSPEKMQKVKEELRSAFPSADDINLTALAKLPYLNACFEEGLRIYPPAPGGMPRMIPKGGDTIANVHLPENTRVYTHKLSIAHDLHNFARPETFAPERWLPNPPAVYANDNLAASKPFSVGPRSCPGTNLAWAEMRLCLANTLRRFDLALCEESENWNKQDIFLLWMKSPLLVTVTPASD